MPWNISPDSTPNHPKEKALLIQEGFQKNWMRFELGTPVTIVPKSHRPSQEDCFNDRFHHNDDDQCANYSSKKRANSAQKIVVRTTLWVIGALLIIHFRISILKNLLFDVYKRVSHHFEMLAKEITPC